MLGRGGRPPRPGSGHGIQGARAGSSVGAGEGGRAGPGSRAGRAARGRGAYGRRPESRGVPSERDGQRMG